MVGVWIAVGVLSLGLFAALVYHTRYFVPGKRREILVTLIYDDKNAIRGVLFSRHGGFLILKMAAIVDAEGTTTRVDGDCVIELAHVGFYQVLPRA